MRIPDEAGHVHSNMEAGHRFLDLKPAGVPVAVSATWRLLPRIEVMMFRPVVLVKRPWSWGLGQLRRRFGS